MTAELLPFLWLLLALLALLVVGRQIRSDMKPVVAGVIVGIAAHAQKNATQYALGAIFAMAASTQALAEVSEKLGWVYVAAACKVLQPTLVSVIAFVRPTPVAKPPGDNGTTPPFVPKPPTV